MLPSGRVAVVGGWDSSCVHCRKDGEIFDPVTRDWKPLPEMKHERDGTDFATSAVSGGMVFVKYHTSSHIFTELYDEASERWFELPHEMPPQLGMGSLVLVPTAALVRTLALPPSSGDGVRENE